MKKLFTLFFLLFANIALFSQNCDKYVITTKYDNFDSITANYKQILLADVGQDAESLPPFFKEMATCWVNRVKNFEVFKSYTIKQEYLDNYPETVFLIFTSRSLAAQEEKQNWFNLMPMMNEEQMYKLYDILEREILKINAIERKYEEKKQQVLKKYGMLEQEDGEEEGGLEVSPQRFVSGLYHVVIGSSEETEIQYAQELEEAYVDWYSRINKIIFTESIDLNETQTTLMNVDYYLKFGPEDELKMIVQDIRDKLMEVYRNDGLNYGDGESGKWYKYLNDSYQNSSFERDMSIEDLREQVEKAGFEAKDEYLVEYSCYYCLYQMIHHNPKEDGNVSDLLQWVRHACNKPELSVYNYVEKDIAKDLWHRLTVSDKKSRINWLGIGEEKRIVSDKNTFNLWFSLIPDASPLYNAEVRADSIYKKSAFSSQDGVWNFMKSISLKQGENMIQVDWEDKKGQKFSDTIWVSYNDNCMIRNDYAILFAVDDYSLGKNGSYQRLDYSISDAENLEKRLQEFGFETHLYKNPTQEKILEVIEEYAFKEYEHPDYDQLLVFFSGHGNRNNLGLGYFVPYDGDSRKPGTTMVYYDHIGKLLDRSKCNHVLFICDACHSGSFLDSATKGELKQSNDIQGRVMKKKTRLFIGSALPENESNQNSELMAEMLKVFDESIKEKRDVVVYYDFLPGLEKAGREQKSFDRWGEDEQGSDFYFNRKK